MPGSGELGNSNLAAADEPPEALREFWSTKARMARAGATWTALDGGRTNAVWKVEAGGQGLVVKLFRAGSDTPLFANDPQAEERALRALSGTGLAPEIVAFAETPVGPSLVYEHVPGHGWSAMDDLASVARAFSTLHGLRPPAGLPRKDTRPKRLLTQTRAMLADLGDTGARLSTREPDLPSDVPPAQPVFLHGDPTASNVLVHDAQVTFIDWQCPAIGDPTEDLAVFLSPGMQTVSGNQPLTVEAEDAFLEAYGSGAVRARYRALAPVYHWRMAVYCHWRAARGDAGYAAAAACELDRLTGPSRSRGR